MLCRKDNNTRYHDDGSHGKIPNRVLFYFRVYMPRGWECSKSGFPADPAMTMTMTMLITAWSATHVAYYMHNNKEIVTSSSK